MVWPQSPTPLILCKPILAQVILTWAKLTTKAIVQAAAWADLGRFWSQWVFVFERPVAGRRARFATRRWWLGAADGCSDLPASAQHEQDPRPSDEGQAGEYGEKGRLPHIQKLAEQSPPCGDWAVLCLTPSGTR